MSSPISMSSRVPMQSRSRSTTLRHALRKLSESTRTRILQFCNLTLTRPALLHFAKWSLAAAQVCSLGSRCTQLATLLAWTTPLHLCEPITPAMTGCFLVAAISGTVVTRPKCTYAGNCMCHMCKQQARNLHAAPVRSQKGDASQKHSCIVPVFWRVIKG